MRHKRIRSRHNPTRIVEECPNCKGGLAPYWNKETDDHGKICYKCNFLILKDRKFSTDDFVTYGK